MMAVPRWVYNRWLQRSVYYARFAVWWVGAAPWPVGHGCFVFGERCADCKQTKPIRVL